jgi:hypothetical protein
MATTVSNRLETGMALITLCLVATTCAVQARRT